MNPGSSSSETPSVEPQRGNLAAKRRLREIFHQLRLPSLILASAQLARRQVSRSKMRKHRCSREESRHPMFAQPCWLRHETRPLPSARSGNKNMLVSALQYAPFKSMYFLSSSSSMLCLSSSSSCRDLRETANISREATTAHPAAAAGYREAAAQNAGNKQQPRPSGSDCLVCTKAVLSSQQGC